jgi:hypothetical protein
VSLSNIIPAVGKVIKRRVIKISLAIFVVVGIVFGLLAVLARNSEPEMSFAFLDGRALAVPVEKNASRTFYSTTRQRYSFETDFDEFCAKVDAELPDMGFKVAPFGSRGIPSNPEYRLGDHVSANNWIVVRIYEDIEFRQLHDSLWRRPAEGWASVEVRRSQLRSWPPQYLLTRLQLMWYRRTNNPRANKSPTGVRAVDSP